MQAAFMAGGLVLTVIGLILTIRGKYQAGHEHMLPKALASTGYMVVALAAGGLNPGYGRAVFIALILCYVGDIALTSHAKRPFMVGLLAFLLAHLVLLWAFWSRGLTTSYCIGAGVAMAPVTIIIARWVLPSVPSNMRVLVVAYMLVITLMVALAAGTFSGGATAVIIAGAIAFYISDIFVARDVFTNPSLNNALIGLPIYYSAVSMLALSITA